jgi:hypothetical protein
MAAAFVPILACRQTDDNDIVFADLARPVLIGVIFVLKEVLMLFIEH